MKLTHTTTNNSECFIICIIYLVNYFSIVLGRRQTTASIALEGRRQVVDSSIVLRWRQTTASIPLEGRRQVVGSSVVLERRRRIADASISLEQGR